MSRPKQRFKSIKQLLFKYNLKKDGKYISREIHDYDYRLALELDDEKNKSLYIKLAKEAERGLLEQARLFIKDAKKVRSKARLFMWKLKELKNGKTKEKSPK